MYEDLYRENTAGKALALVKNRLTMFYLLRIVAMPCNKKIYTLLLLLFPTASYASQETVIISLQNQVKKVALREAKEAAEKAARIVEEENKIRKAVAQGRWKLCGCESCLTTVATSLVEKNPNSKL